MPGPTLRGYLSYLLSHAERRVNQELGERLRDEGVTLEQWRVLVALADGVGHTMGELADAVLVNHPTLTKIVDRMVSSALVYRQQGEYDRRTVLVHLSDRGRALLERLEVHADAHQAAITDAYGEREVEQLMRALEVLAGCLPPPTGRPTTDRAAVGRPAAGRVAARQVRS